MHFSVVALAALVSLAVALPSPVVTSSHKTTATSSHKSSAISSHKAASTGAPPLSPEEAQKIFENKDLHVVPQVVPHLLTVSASPKPSSSVVPPKPTVVVAAPPAATESHHAPPGIPTTGNIQVKPAMNIPLSSVIGNNQSHNVVPRELTGRASCQNYPYCCPDPRYLNENTAFPYNVIGRFWSPVGSCTGTLVGPRHVLTAAHCISWLNCFKSFSGQLQFAVDYWPGHAPAIYYGETVYHYDASACGDPANVVQQGIDYVVVVLSEKTGLPYMGLKAYNPAWNGPKYWYQQGYAGDAGGSVYPYIQGPFSVVKEFAEGFGDLLEYAACDTPGDSGSPVWSWWSDGPYIVGLMTEVGQQLGANAGWGPAGNALLTLVSRARSLYP